MIASFACKETEHVWNQEYSKRSPPAIQRVMLRKLIKLSKSVSLEDLKCPPSNRLEKLKRDREGQYSIRVNDQYRICFRWQSGNAFNVEIVDYH
jgi:proteic killer suppression protein